MLNSNLNDAICSKIAKSILFLAIILYCIPAHAQQKGSKSSYVDTFKLADKFLAKKKFRKASKLYTAYSKNHPKDVNATWKLAQVKLWQNKNRQSDNAYKQALKLDPKNDNLNLNYIHSLLDMGKLGEAGARLTDMELAGKDYPNMSFLRAKLNYYKGDYKEAAAYIHKDLNAENDNPESQELSDMIEFARSPLLSAQVAYLSDNQPLAALISTIKGEKYFNRYATLYLVADEYHFVNNKRGDAPWVRFGNKMYFSEATLHLNTGLGIVKFPVNDKIGWSGNIALNKRISAYFDGDLSLDHVPYMDTKTSIDTNISVTRFAAMLNWHMNNWSAQAAFLNSAYGNGQNVYGAYAWGLAPIVQFKGGRLSGGYSVSYSNSTESSFKVRFSPDEALLNYSNVPNYDLNAYGLYDPYFTPNNLFINSALIALNLNPSKVVSINLSGDIGYGTILNPYLYVDKDNAGNNVIKRDFTSESFIPASATVAMNFNLDKTWMLTTKYTYRSTFFFSSHYASLGIQKSFQRRNRARGVGNASTFSRLIKDIEDKIQGLYNCKTPEELKGRVGKIRQELVTLRDTQRNKSERLPDADMQERYDNLDEMINELDAVNLNDYDGKGKKDKKQWLVEKQHELTLIGYPGSL
ncbi:MAG: hypothetical protein K0Q79_787 [Flavipsychrobacter sp.]|jgi:Tfp pilus assembly protein PilF|nr:hypothetical protein [Flavipsychrobacter sp.]